MVPDHHGGVAQDPLVGQVLSKHYRILQKLGEGAMAAVYLAEHTGVGATIVLKVLLPELANEPLVVESFLREARIASEIQHENVIDIFYSGRSPEGQVFLAMEFVNGPTLYDLLQREGPLPWKRAKAVLVQIASALAAAHNRGVVHRDIKPENVLVGAKDSPTGPVEFVKVVDFGIANAREDIGGAQGVSGTPEFMPPEQAQGLPPDPRDDVYAFGCLMYQVLTGDVPFRDSDVAKVLLMHLRDPPVPPRQVRPDLEIPAQAQAVVLKALEKKREDRWQSMTELHKALDAVMFAPDPVAEPAPAPAPTSPAAKPGSANLRGRIVLPHERARGRSKLPLVIVALLVMGGGGYAFFQHFMSHSPGRIEIWTEPAEAEIYIDGQKMADRSPMFLDASPGTYKVLVRSAGFETLEAKLTMRPRASERVTLPLKALPVPKSPPSRRSPSAASASAATAAAESRRHHAPVPPVTGVTFIDFKKAAAEQKSH